MYVCCEKEIVCDFVRGTPVFHMSKSFHDDLKGCKGDWKFSHPA